MLSKRKNNKENMENEILYLLKNIEGIKVKYNVEADDYYFPDIEDYNNFIEYLKDYLECCTHIFMQEAKYYHKNNNKIENEFTQGIKFIDRLAVMINAIQDKNYNIDTYDAKYYNEKEEDFPLKIKNEYKEIELTDLVTDEKMYLVPTLYHETINDTRKKLSNCLDKDVDYNLAIQFILSLDNYTNNYMYNITKYNSPSYSLIGISDMEFDLLNEYKLIRNNKFNDKKTGDSYIAVDVVTSRDRFMTFENFKIVDCYIILKKIDNNKYYCIDTHFFISRFKQVIDCERIDNQIIKDYKSKLYGKR